MVIKTKTAYILFMRWLKVTAMKICIVYTFCITKNHIVMKIYWRCNKIHKMLCALIRRRRKKNVMPELFVNSSSFFFHMLDSFTKCSRCAYYNLKLGLQFFTHFNTKTFCICHYTKQHLSCWHQHTTYGIQK